MLYQDRLGMLYEIPDSQVYGLGYADPYGAADSQIVYDGLGNPVGAWPFSNIAKAVGGLVKKALPAVSSFIPGGALISQAVPALAQGMAPGAPAPPVPSPVPVPAPLPVASPAPGPMPGALPQVPGAPAEMMPGAPGMPPPGYPMPRPWPMGWVRPPLPYTGLGPKRLYMRCAVWPGPEGLVPAIAAQAPAAQAQAAGVAAAQTAAAMIRRPRYFARRRR
jgi:hypothetical protein